MVADYETQVMDEAADEEPGTAGPSMEEPSAGAAPEGSLSARCQASVEVSEPPKGKQGMGQAVGGVALVLVGLWCLSVWLTLPGIIFAGFGVFLIVRARKAVGGRATKSVLVEVGYATGILSILMTGARLFDGRYVDQLYTAMEEDIERAWFDADCTFHLRARAMGSTAMSGDDVLEYRSREQTEIVFKTDAPGRGAIEGLLAQTGVRMGA